MNSIVTADESTFFTLTNMGAKKNKNRHLKNKYFSVVFVFYYLQNILQNVWQRPNTFFGRRRRRLQDMCSFTNCRAGSAVVDVVIVVVVVV